VSPHRRITATSYGSPHARVREALEKALPEVTIGADPHQSELIRAAALSARVIEHGREVDRVLDALAAHVVEQAQGLVQELGAIRVAAAKAEHERVERAPKVSHLRRGAVA
jgi:hypothetical protein